MDYGPFGWMEEYNPLFAKWTGSGKHFGFMNQVNAGFANLNVLVESLAPIVGDDAVQGILEECQPVFRSAMDEAFRLKLGFQADQDVADDLWDSLDPLMRQSRTDWTIFFRELSYLTRDTSKPNDFGEYLKKIEKAFYEPIPEDLVPSWTEWMEKWHTALVNSGSIDSAFERMKSTNPKYVLREWMLVDAYTKANDGDYSELQSLFELIQKPYDEGTSDQVERYYRKAREDVLTKGGTGFMS